MLGWLTLAVLAAIFFLGLWPFNVRPADIVRWLTSSKRQRLALFPPNEVTWLKNGPGLRFGEHGSVFSEVPLRVDSQGGEACALELWIRPTLPNYVTTVLAFTTKQNPLQFLVRQLENSLELSRVVRDEKGAVRKERMVVTRVFPFRKYPWILITISADADGTVVYVDGKRRNNNKNFKMNASDLAGRIVLGDSPQGHEPWTGELGGLAIYPAAMTERQAAQDYALWNLDNGLSTDGLPPAMALYRFQERDGREAKSAKAGAPDLTMPETYATVYPAFLRPFWKEYEETGRYWVNTLLNVAAFVPLGFFLYGYLSASQRVNGPMLAAVAAGFLVSLTVEVLQYFLPLRDSGMTDLITNTAGTWLGAALFRGSFQRDGLGGWLGALKRGEGRGASGQ